MSTPIITLHEISKHYRSVQALKQVSFSIPKGSIYGILGPNGSGKTTLLSIILEVILPSSGGFKWENNLAGQTARKHIGSLLETPNFYPYLTAVQNLKINCTIKEVDNHDIDRVLKIVKLDHRKHHKFSTYSLGMKQRLAIANALLGTPEVLILDEPTNGLDPEGIAEMRQLIKEINQTGITVLLASHLLDEVEKVCTHMAILRKGDLLTDGMVSDIIQDTPRIYVSSNNMHGLEELLKKSSWRFTQEDELFVIQEANLSTEQINNYCFEHGIVLNGLQAKSKSLETYFIEMTQEK